MKSNLWNGEVEAFFVDARKKLEKILTQVNDLLADEYRIPQELNLAVTEFDAVRFALQKLHTLEDPECLNLVRQIDAAFQLFPAVQLQTCRPTV